FRLAPAPRDEHRDRGHPRSWSCRDTTVAGEQVTLLIDQHRYRPSPFADGGGKLVEVGLTVEPGVVGIGDQPLDRPTLDPIGRPGTCRARLYGLRLPRHILFPSPACDASARRRTCPRSH